MAVCKAKYDEGFNFPDDLCRAVVIVGLPYEYLYSQE